MADSFIVGPTAGIKQVDAGIRWLVVMLRLAGLDTDWSCSGEAGHMCIRPTIQIKTFPGAGLGSPGLAAQQQAIELVLSESGVKDYWLALVFSQGKVDVHGGEPTWLLQLPGRFDSLAIPVGLAAQRQAPGYVVEDYEALKEQTHG